VIVSSLKFNASGKAGVAFNDQINGTPKLAAREGFGRNVVTTDPLPGVGTRYPLAFTGHDRPSMTCQNAPNGNLRIAEAMARVLSARSSSDPRAVLIPHSKASLSM
jgi:hypothetical protein